MELIWFLLRASWPTAVFASLTGAISGAASVGLVVAILHTLRSPDHVPMVPMLLFVALSAVVLTTRVICQLLVSRLTQKSVSRLRMGLCGRILASPLKHLEEIGADRLLAALTGDVFMASAAMSGIPGLAVNIVILVCGLAYLGWLSPMLLLGSVLFGGLGFASYWFSAAFARRYEQRAREAQDDLIKGFRCMIEGIKEMKMHHDRRREFFAQILEPADATVRDNRYLSDSFQNTAIAWGRLMFFIAIGLLLFVWPIFFQVDETTLMGYTLTVFYLMSPLEQILGWLPFVAMASASVDKLNRLDLMLNEEESEQVTLTTVEAWEEIELSNVTHSYQCQGREHEFQLGPINLTLRPREIVFIVGGNGSGKTTLAKLIAGLYVPQQGGIRLNSEWVTDETRESYRQLFSVVFDNATVFDSLLGLQSQGVDQRAADYLRQLELDHVVRVEDGVFSTTSLSRGQRKRLALVTAYLEDRSIYLFDEWAADQDPVFKSVFYERILPDLKLRGKTVVAVTHDDRYFDIADRVEKLEDGKIVDRSRVNFAETTRQS
jgi:putative ATP-binding cassette transporter